MKRALLLAVFTALILPQITTAQNGYHEIGSPYDNYQGCETNYYGTTVDFNIDGIFFQVYNDGHFDYQVRRRPAACSCNNGYYGGDRYCNHRPKPRVIYGRYGEIVQIGNVAIRYNRFGRPVRIGQVNLGYRGAVVANVGGMYLNYGSRGRIIRKRGTIYKKPRRGNTYAYTQYNRNNYFS